MEAKTKLTFLVVFYTTGTVSAYLILFAFGATSEFDWRFWVGTAPQASVCLVFGYFASNWKQILGFSLMTSLIDLIFLGATLYFVPEIWDAAIVLYQGALGIFLISAAVIMFAFSLLLLSIGFVASRLTRQFPGSDEK